SSSSSLTFRCKQSYNGIYFGYPNDDRVRLEGTYLNLQGTPNWKIQWSVSGNTPNGTKDLHLGRDSEGTLGVYTGSDGSTLGNITAAALNLSGDIGTADSRMGTLYGT